MVKTKQTKCGGSSTRPVGITAARFDNLKEDQFEDIPEEDWPDMENPKVAQPQATEATEGEASKSAGNAGEGEGSKAVDKPTPTGAEGGAQAPPDTAKAPTTNPQEPKAGTSTDPTDPQDPQDPKQENEPGLAAHVNSYRQAVKIWFDTVQASKEQAYVTLYDTLLKIGDPHIAKLGNSDRKTVLDCIADKSGKYLSEDDFAVYVEREDVQTKKKQFAVSIEAKAAIKEYYEAAQGLCEAQTVFMKKTRELEALVNKEIFLDIIRQVQLPAVQVMIRMREQEETLEGKMYWELTLLKHLPNYKTIHPSANEQSRTMAAFIYFVLHEQVTGKQKSQLSCSTEFQCQTTSFKCLVTGKKQPGRPGRLGEAGKSSRKLEEVMEMEGGPAPKKPKGSPR